MPCAVGSQAGEEDAGIFLEFSKTITFPEKGIPTKLNKTKDIYVVMHFSPETTRKPT